ncbi:30S ribosomal protein S5 [Candidatus Anstonella stagnisolia]|nr:30S ribosomal protein S5 [Candidatus Anstonella stagnisolia]
MGPTKEEIVAAWVPKSDIGKKVKAKQILSIEEIYDMGGTILEAEIADALLPNLQEETLEVSSTQRMTDCGRKMQFRAIVLVGDKNGHFGIGSGKSEEVKPAIESAVKDAKRNIVCVPLGCGSWECGCKTAHSIPIKVIGKQGSVEVTLKPAPRGLGIAANKIVKKVLTFAGVKDVWSFSRGHTETIFNNAMAVRAALQGLNTMRFEGEWKAKLKSVEMAAPAAEASA